MDGTFLVRYKISTVITIAVVIFMISSLLVINIELIGIQRQSKSASEKIIHDPNSHFGQDTFNNYFTKPSIIQEELTTKVISNETFEDPKNSKIIFSSYMSLESSAVCSFIKTCTVRCKGGTLQEAVNEANGLLENENKCTTQYISLELNSVTFPYNTISLGWLKDLKVKINGLKIESSDIEELGDSAFAGTPFGSVGNPLSLTLTDTSIKYLRKSTFTGSSIIVLEIRASSMRQGINIEENLLGDTSYPIQVISINYCIGDGEAVRNLTAKGTVLAGLRTLDLNYNFIIKLESDIFSKAPNLEQLYLTSIGIVEIEVGAFAGLNKLTQLFINRNSLKKVPQGVFDDLDSILSLYLDDNPWNCTCDMQWFKQYVMSLPQIEYRRCKQGAEWITMEDVEFCSPGETTERTTTISPVTSKSTKAPVTTDTSVTTDAPITVPVTTPKNLEYFIFEKIWCRNLLSLPFDNVTDDDANLLLASVFKRRNINFTIIEIGMSLTYRVDLAGAVKATDFLIWTNVENRSDYGCVYNIHGFVLINLQFQSTYTICFSSNDTVDTYALIADDCTAVSTPPDWSYRVWLRNNQKTAVILGVIFTFLVTLAIASGAVYYLVKYNPELIKGSKRVLIVKKGSYSPNVLVMPSKKDAIRQVSLCTNHEGYLTPKLKRWAKNKFLDLRYQELDTISDNSINNDCSSAKMITPEYDKINENNIYEPPPPLPPNHPSKRRDSGRPYFYSNM